VSTPTAGRPRLRQLRDSAGWTQQELADKLVYLAWTRGDKNVGVNADMVAKWERGVKGISARYRLLLCELFGVTAAELGVAPPTPATRPPAATPARDPESLIAMLDQAATLLNQLGAPGNALAPQLLSAWKDTATTRRTMLGLLDPAATDPAGHARAATATLTDLQQLADRYHALYATADPTALLSAVTAHVKLASQALHRDHTTPQRRALLRNLAHVATLAGRLTAEDLGDTLTGRAYYALALDTAREADDHHTTAIALGHTAQLAHTEGHTTAALDHLTTATALTTHPAITSWLAGIQATIHADRGDHNAAHDALNRAQRSASHPHDRSDQALPDFSTAHLLAVTGHVQLRANNPTARDTLTKALNQLPPTARRTRITILLDLATAELQAGDLPTACRQATNAARILNHTPYATGAARLRAFRNAAATSHAEPKVLRVIDEHLARSAA
jgi:transcriptional regulator with XRE-family HTH domain